MIEFLRHAFGLCGEGHPSIFFALGLGPFLMLIRMKFSSWIRSIRSHLQAFHSVFGRNRRPF